jgi:hypothetical protein
MFGGTVFHPRRRVLATTVSIRAHAGAYLWDVDERGRGHYLGRYLGHSDGVWQASDLTHNMVQQRTWNLSK